MWDYNIGLVRTTHLFKCNGYSKACGVYLAEDQILTKSADYTRENAEC